MISYWSSIVRIYLSCTTVSGILALISQNSKRSCHRECTPIFRNFKVYNSSTHHVNLQTKFEMSSVIRFKDMAWITKCGNELRDPDHAHLGDSLSLQGSGTRIKIWSLRDFVGAKFYCPHALADGNQRILIGEKTLEFSSKVLSTLSAYVMPSGVVSTRSSAIAVANWSVRQNRAVDSAWRSVR